MSTEWLEDDDQIDPTVLCSNCDAVCCRLTVVVMPEDRPPAHMVTRDPGGLEVMAHGDDGWCIALDRNRMCCGIYEQRPDVCRRFEMGAGYCREERSSYRKGLPREIPIHLCGA